MGTYVERFQQLEQASQLHLKGWKFTEISRELDITPAAAKKLVDEYKELVRERAQDDPDLLDRLTENTIEMIDQISMIEREAWETFSKAKEYDALNMQTQALKLAMDLTERKAKLLQLMGAKADSSVTARMQRAERVNEIVSRVISDIVSECPRCRTEAQIKLAEAFNLMDRQDPNLSERQSIDAVIIEDEEHTE